jgi:hypothetical protein
MLLIHHILINHFSIDIVLFITLEVVFGEGLELKDYFGYLSKIVLKLFSPLIHHSTFIKEVYHIGEDENDLNTVHNLKQYTILSKMEGDDLKLYEEEYKDFDDEN